MISPHQSRNVPWSILVEYESLGKRVKTLIKNDWNRREDERLNHPSGTASSDADMDVQDENSSRPEDSRKASAMSGRLDFLARCLQETILDFASTESPKFNRAEADSLVKLYPDSEMDNIFLARFQTSEGWRKWLGDLPNQKRSVMSAGGELTDIVKELFNREMMLPLIHLARNVPGIEQLSWITYSNFFHYGYRRTLEDAMFIYLLFNFLAAGNLLERWERLPGLLGSFTGSEDHDASLRVYREKIGIVEKDEPVNISNENIKELQRFSFRCLYQYHVFWEEVVASSGGKPIDWECEVRQCIDAYF